MRPADVPALGAGGQEWAFGKKVARVIKRPVAPQPQSTVPPPAYARQFMQHFSKKFVGDAQELPPGSFVIPAGRGPQLTPEPTPGLPCIACCLAGSAFLTWGGGGRAAAAAVSGDADDGEGEGGCGGGRADQASGESAG